MRFTRFTVRLFRPTGCRNASSDVAKLERMVSKLSEQVAAIERVQRSEMSSVTDVIRYYATKTMTPVSLHTIVKNCSSADYKPARFMRRETPVRLAHCWLSLGTLPAGLPHIGPITTARKRLHEVFTEVVECPPWSSDPAAFNLKRFIALMIKVNNVLGDAHLLTASGVKEFRDAANRRTSLELASRPPPTTTAPHTAASSLDDPLVRLHVAHDVFPLIQERLDNFNRTRIALSFLVGQFLSLPDPAATIAEESAKVAAAGGGSGGAAAGVSSSNTSLGSLGTVFRSGQVGLVATTTPLGDVARDAVDEVEGMCVNNYGIAPSVEIVGDVGCVIPHVPTHLRYVLVELLKNAFRAVVELHGDDGAGDMPAIVVRVVESEDEVCIAISDRGGGIPRSEQRRVWSYLYTTADDAHANGGVATPRGQGALAGFGYGLPISRLYARAFGGKLRLYSVEGVGTDVYMHLQKRAVAAGEAQPPSQEEAALHASAI